MPMRFIKMRNNDGNVTTLMQNKYKMKVLPSDTWGKLNDILLCTYHCVINKKKKKQTEH